MVVRSSPCRVGACIYKRHKTRKNQKEDLHTDPKVGEAIGFGGIIAHGMLIMGFVGQLLSDFAGPTAQRAFGVRFRGMTHLDDVITCTGTITDKYEADGEGRIAGRVQAADQTGNVKVTGTFVAALPKRS